ncbi:MAG TPA: plastocyanin/azurin family copper-binding protein [Actinomycetota bacterium]|nr:plastocyanin/azurin family copper-binding protein [Actinomycetota bacterium]
MRLIQYQPGAVEIKAGEKAVWSQTDAGFHTVTSGTVARDGGTVIQKPDGRFSSDRLAKGQQFSFTFSEPGTYPYFCEIHPATMTGEVRVGA